MVGILLSGAVYAMSSETKVFQPFPENHAVTYSAEEMPLTAWFFAHWKSLGYKVPSDGDKFLWKQYVVNVEDLSSVQNDDLVIYANKDGSFDVALVVEVNGITDKKAIAVMVPIPGGLIMIRPLNKDEILGVGRPVQRTNQKSTILMPTHPPLA